jgi:hypothetical protein
MGAWEPHPAQRAPAGLLCDTLSISAEHLGSWEPLQPEQAAELLADVEARWWIAGGWAIDILVGHQSRVHADLDVLILRPEQHLFRSHLSPWDVQAADPPGSLRPWLLGEMLPAHVHDVWCRPDSTAPWSFQFMIDDVDGDDWMFRRDKAIRRPVSTLTSRASRPGMPVLAAEVELLYKSKGMRQKDSADFETVLPHLAHGEREWLRRALMATNSRQEWVQRL